MDDLIISVLGKAEKGLRSEEIKRMLNYENLDNKKFDRAMRRLWSQGRIKRMYNFSKWGKHYFYVPSKPEGYIEEVRLEEALTSAVLSYLTMLIPKVGFEKAYYYMCANIQSFATSLRDPVLKQAYMDFFSPPKQGRGAARFRGDASER